MSLDTESERWGEVESKKIKEGMEKFTTTEMRRHGVAET